MRTKMFLVWVFLAAVLAVSSVSAEKKEGWMVYPYTHWHTPVCPISPEAHEGGPGGGQGAAATTHSLTDPFGSWEEARTELDIANEGVFVGEVTSLEQYRYGYADRFNSLFYGGELAFLAGTQLYGGLLYAGAAGPVFAGDNPAGSLGPIAQVAARNRFVQAGFKVVTSPSMTRTHLRGFYAVASEQVRYRGVDFQRIGNAIQLGERVFRNRAWESLPTDRLGNIIWLAADYARLFGRASKTITANLVLYVELVRDGQVVYAAVGNAGTRFRNSYNEVFGIWSFSLDHPVAQPLAQALVANAIQAGPSASLRNLQAVRETFREERLAAERDKKEEKEVREFVQYLKTLSEDHREAVLARLQEKLGEHGKDAVEKIRQLLAEPGG